MNKRLALKRAFRTVAYKCVVRRGRRGAQANLTKDHDWKQGGYLVENVQVFLIWDDEGTYVEMLAADGMEMSETGMGKLVDYSAIIQTTQGCDINDPAIAGVDAAIRHVAQNEASRLADALLELMDSKST